MVVSNITYNFLDTGIHLSKFTFYILDSALSLDETAEEILDEDAVLGVSNKCSLNDTWKFHCNI